MALGTSRHSLRWIDYARRSMQRAGFVKWALNLSSTSRPQTLESLSTTFSNGATRRIPLSNTSRSTLEAYVRQQRIKRYKEPLQTSAIEIQDRYLSDRQLPSRTGAISGDIQQKGYRHTVYVEI